MVVLILKQVVANMLTLEIGVSSDSEKIRHSLKD